MKKAIILFIITLSTISYGAEKYSMYFADVRYNHRKGKFYFIRYDILRQGERNELRRYVRGDFNGKFLVKVTKFYKGTIQSELFINKKSICTKKKDYIKGKLRYELFYNKRGFVPYSPPTTNLIRKITYKYGRPVKLTILNGNGRVLSSRKFR